MSYLKKVKDSFHLASLNSDVAILLQVGHSIKVSVICVTENNFQDFNIKDRFHIDFICY